MSVADKETAVSQPAVDPAKIHQVQEFKYSSPLIGCRFDPTGRFVFGSAQDSALQRWEMATGKKTAFVGNKSWVRGMAFLARDQVIFTGGYDGRVLAWQVA